LCQLTWDEAIAQHGKRRISVYEEVPHVTQKENDDNRRENCRQLGEREALARPCLCGPAGEFSHRPPVSWV
jgi:hypothetical protein